MLTDLARRYLWPWFGAALLLFGGLATLVIAGRTAFGEERLLRSGEPISTWLGIAGLLLLGAVIGTLGGFLFWSSLRRFRLEEHLVREGVSAAATVTSVVQSGWRNRQPLWVIGYRYTDDLGDNHDGRQESLSPEEARRWKVGDTGSIRYDRRHPAASVWLGRL